MFTIPNFHLPTRFSGIMSDSLSIHFICIVMFLVALLVAFTLLCYHANHYL
jgi:hypothetical protein